MNIAVVHVLTFISNSLPTAGQFNGTGGPEDDIKIQARNHGGDQEVPNL